MVAKVEWHPGELFPRFGFVVTNLPMEPDWIIRFCNQRGTAEQQIWEGKQAVNWVRLSCKGIAQRSLFGALKNSDSGPGCRGFAARSAKRQAVARPQTPIGAKKTCSTAEIKRS